MEFVYPTFLSALIALSIPIVIHLFNLKRFKKVVFPNVRLLKAIEFETKSQSKIRHLLILLSRLLALTFLVFAFTLPFFTANSVEKADNMSKKRISVYVDNSFSMSSINEERTLLDEAIKAAQTIAANSDPTAAYQLITNDFKAGEENWLSKEQFIEQLYKVELTPRFRSVSDVIVRQDGLSDNRDGYVINAYLISDFQKSTLDFSDIPNDSTFKITFLPLLPSTANNVYIDSLWFDSPIRQYGNMEKLSVRLVNDADDDLVEVPVKLYINGVQKTPGIVDLPAKSSKILEMNYLNSQYGSQKGEVVIRDYPVTFDDNFYFSYNVDSTIGVLIINGEKENKNLTSIYSGEGFHLLNQNERNVDFSAFNESNLIIFNELTSVSSGLIQEARRFLNNGGHLVIIPSEEGTQDRFNELTSELGLPAILKLDTANTTVSQINTGSILYREVFEEVPRNANMPLVSSHYRFSNSGLKNKEDLLPLKSGGSLLTAYYPENGTVYLFSTPMKQSYSSFVMHSMVVPTFYNMALYSQQKQVLFHTIGTDKYIEIPNKGNSEAIFHIQNENSDFLPETQVAGNKYRLFMHDQLRNAGNAVLFAETTTDTTALSFNYDRQESRLSFPEKNELTDLINRENLVNVEVFDGEVRTELASFVSFATEGKHLWKYCLILALIFVITEMLLTKFWK